MTIDPNGRPCACGSRGCLETLAGLEPLLEMAGLDPSDAATTTGSGEPVSELATRARMGDQQALDALRDAGHWLGIGIASAANLLNFQAVVLGGFFAQLATWLAAPIARELETHVLASEWGVPAAAAVHARARGRGARRRRALAAARAHGSGLGRGGMRLALALVLALALPGQALAAETSPGVSLVVVDPRARRHLRARRRAAPLRLGADRGEHLRHLGPARARARGPARAPERAERGRRRRLGDHARLRRPVRRAWRPARDRRARSGEPARCSRASGPGRRASSTSGPRCPAGAASGTPRRASRTAATRGWPARPPGST